MSFYTNYRDKYLGKPIDTDHAFGAQCVDVITGYIYRIQDKLGMERRWIPGNAIDYANKNSRINEFCNRIRPIEMKQGDIVVWGGSLGYGHIAIVDRVTDTAFWVFQQDGFKNKISRTGKVLEYAKSYIGRKSMENKDLLAVFRLKPKYQLDIYSKPKKPVLTPIKTHKRTITKPSKASQVKYMNIYNPTTKSGNTVDYEANQANKKTADKSWLNKGIQQAVDRVEPKLKQTKAYDRGQRFLKRMGIPATTIAGYITHQLGAGGVKINNLIGEHAEVLLVTLATGGAVWLISHIAYKAYKKNPNNTRAKAIVRLFATRNRPTDNTKELFKE